LALKFLDTLPEGQIRLQALGIFANNWANSDLTSALACDRQALPGQGAVGNNALEQLANPGAPAIPTACSISPRTSPPGNFAATLMRVTGLQLGR
jgi:hypothetical protein